MTIGKQTIFLFLTLISIHLWSSAEVFKNEEELQSFIEKKRNFSFELDTDSNDFPDVWFLENGPDFQDYHSVLISPDRQGRTDKASLFIAFSGGKSGVRSGALRLDPRFAYDIKLYHKSKNLGIDKKFEHKISFGLHAYDDQEKLIKTFKEDTMSFSKDWTQSPILDIKQLPKETDSCVLFIHLEGKIAGRSFLWVDDMSITARPRVTFTTAERLNIFPFGKEMQYTQTIEGTEVNKTYAFKTRVTDFMGSLIEEDLREIKGNTQTIVEKFDLNKIPNEMSGVYYVNSVLSHKGKAVVTSDAIIARNAKRENSTLSPSFGVLLGRPTSQPKDLLHALKSLGAKLSKIELLPEPFHLKQYSTEKGLSELHTLLRKEAPDEGFKFIGVLNRIPQETKTHDDFALNPAKHIIQTFDPFKKEWELFFEDVLFKYGNVITDWQFGDDSEPIQNEYLNSGNLIVDHLNKKADWMNILMPSDWKSTNDKTMKTVYLPADNTIEHIFDKFKATPQKDLSVTIELKSNALGNRKEIISDLTKKMTVLRSMKDGEKKPIVKHIFIDQLKGETQGLMTEDYKPRATYFAARTLMTWLQGAEALGSITLADKEIQNYVFENHKKAFIVLWRKTPKKGIRLDIGDSIEFMDLMGNRRQINNLKDHSIRVDLGPTPVILFSPYPDLYRTMLSFKLTVKDIGARVQLQDQLFEVQNHFKNRAKFDFDFSYPSDWLVQNTIWTSEIAPQDKGRHTLSLAPSSLSPVGQKIPVHAKLNISLIRKKGEVKTQNHFVTLYREDELKTDVLTELRFYKTENGLQMDIQLGLSEAADRGSSFTASALMPDGQTYEAYFKDVQPGTQSIQKLYVLEGEEFIGKDVSLEIRENVGNRYINKTFSIQLSN